MTSFPPGFTWGAATAAHQVEGNNVNSDLWVLEHCSPTLFEEPSLDACDHYHRFAEDIRLLAGLGLNCYRFSIEWARIEPERGHFSIAALDHYRRMLAACHENGVTPMVTFYHFSSPRWFAGFGGWEKPAAVDLFVRYCERAARHFGDLIWSGVHLQRTQPADAAALDFAHRYPVHHGDADEPAGGARHRRRPVRLLLPGRRGQAAAEHDRGAPSRGRRTEVRARHIPGGRQPGVAG